MDQSALTKLAAVSADKPVTTAEINDAMQRIMDTGLFADIRYAVDDRALTFTVTPESTSSMLPAVFSNFIFWKPEEIPALVHARVPLFTGQVPINGNLQQSVQDALAAIVLDRGIKASIGAMASQELATHKAVVSFFIAQPTIQIRQVHVDSVSSIAQPRVADALQSFANSDFDRHSDEAIRQRLMDTYHDLGFLDVVIDLPRYNDPKIEASQILIDFTTSAHEGSQYRIAKLDWPESGIVSKSDFEKAAQFKKGDIASHTLLLATNAHIEIEFGHHGYADARVTVQEHKDDSNHTVEYAFAVAPGEIYHLKSVNTLNFTDKQQKDFSKAWKLQPGSVYDAAYPSTFLASSSPDSFQGYSASTRATANPSDHTIDLVITLTKRGIALH